MDWKKFKKDFLLSNYFAKRKHLFNKCLNTLNGSITSVKANGDSADSGRTIIQVLPLIDI